MRKFNKNFYGASLTALAFSLNIPAATAQTCTTPPDCATLGFTKTAADCSGHSVLKCPFNQSKVYCDSGASSGSSGETKTYTVGDAYYSNNQLLGVIIEVNNNSVVVASGLRGNLTSEIDDYCASLGTEWFAPTVSYAKKITSVYGSQVNKTWSYLRLAGSGGDYCMGFSSTTTWPKSSCTNSSYTLYSACLTSAPK